MFERGNIEGGGIMKLIIFLYIYTFIGFYCSWILAGHTELIEFLGISRNINSVGASILIIANCSGVICKPRLLMLLFIVLCNAALVLSALSIIVGIVPAITAKCW